MKLTPRYRARFCFKRKVHAVLRCFLLFSLCLTVLVPQPQPQQPAQPVTEYLLKPAHVWDGESAQLHDNWAVLVRGEKIEAVGPASSINAPAAAKGIDLP